MARHLAIVEIEGEKFYDDERIREYRHVDKIMHYIPYDQLGDRKVKLLKEAWDDADLLPKKSQPGLRNKGKTI